MNTRSLAPLVAALCVAGVRPAPRATLLTGKHAARLRMTIWSEGAIAGGPKNRKLLQAESRPDLAHAEGTVAGHLRAAGYITALVGKWHLGDAEHAPETHGFDVNIGGTHWGAPATFFWPYRGAGVFGPETRYVPHLEFGEPVILTDLFRTLLTAAGAPAPEEAADGIDLGPLLRDPGATLERDALFFHYPHYYATTTPAGAVRARDWKLVEYFEDHRVELFHLREDPSETRDLAARMSERAEALRARLRAWRESVGAAMPRAR